MTDTQADVTLELARAEDFLLTVPDRSVSLCFIDPPYNRVLAEDWDHQWSSVEEYLAWLGGIMDELVRVLALNGSIYVCASPDLSDLVSAEVIRPRLRRLNEAVWVKPMPKGGGCGLPAAHGAAGQASREAMRAYWPGSERIIFAEHRGADSVALADSGYGALDQRQRDATLEPLRRYLDDERKAAGVTHRQVDQHLGTNGMARHYFRDQLALPTAEVYAKLRTLFNRGGGDHLRRSHEDLRREYEDLRREYEDLRRPFSVTSEVPWTDVWTYPTVPQGQGRHPAEKPLAMLRDVVRASSRPGDLVLDCFSGRATTACACVDEGRSFIGCEMDPEIHAAGLDRIEKHESIAQGRSIETRPVMTRIEGPLFPELP